jgi:hypothetical protein
MVSNSPNNTRSPLRFAYHVHVRVPRHSHNEQHWPVGSSIGDAVPFLRHRN